MHAACSGRTVRRIEQVQYVQVGTADGRDPPSFLSSNKCSPCARQRWGGLVMKQVKKELPKST